MRGRYWKLTDYQVAWLEEYARQTQLPEDEILRRAVDEFIKRRLTNDPMFGVAARASERQAKKRRKAEGVEEQLEQENWESGEEVVTFGLDGGARATGMEPPMFPKRGRGRLPGQGMPGGARKKTPFDREVERERKNQD